MAGGREIRTKIKSVQNTRKVTRALEMVSASKIRKAQELMKASRPYARAMRQVIGHIAKANSEYKHPFLGERAEIKRVGYIVVSTDRGLCGGLNSNLFRKLLAEIRGWQEKSVEVDIVAIGTKANAFFKRLKVNLVGSATHLGEKPKIEQLIGVIKVMLDAYSCAAHRPPDPRLQRFRQHDDAEGRRSTSCCRCRPRRRWPQHTTGTTSTNRTPKRCSITCSRAISSRWYISRLLENLASEHAARMVAMKSASDNASKAIDSLTLIYNKARQAAITQEISEIVSGAAAV